MKCEWVPNDAAFGAILNLEVAKLKYVINGEYGAEGET
jgi:hypothetical protein